MDKQRIERHPYFSLRSLGCMCGIVPWLEGGWMFGLLRTDAIVISPRLPLLCVCVCACICVRNWILARRTKAATFVLLGQRTLWIMFRSSIMRHRSLWFHSTCGRLFPLRWANRVATVGQQYRMYTLIAVLNKMETPGRLRTSDGEHGRKWRYTILTHHHKQSVSSWRVSVMHE